MRRSISVVLLSGFLLGPALINCSSSSSSSTTPAQACQDIATALCERIQACSPLLIQLSYGNVATCVARAQLSCAPVFGANGVTATPADFEGCVGSVNGLSCAELFSINQSNLCSLPVGTLATGTACGTNAQCQSNYCKTVGTAQCGACGTKVAVGGACTMDSDCPAESACEAGTCVADGQSGATCDATHPCAEPLICKTGTCSAPATAGQACTTGTCDSTQGLYCGTQTNTCASVATAMAGGACGLMGMQYTACAAGATCKMGSATSGTCQAPAADGSTCDDVGGPFCFAPATCINKVCTLPDPGSCN